MTGNSLTAFVLFWGIWLLVPILIDGSLTFAQLVGVWLAERRKRRRGWLDFELKSFPRVSVVIPVHNGARSLGTTIESLRSQTYPRRQIEVIVVDNGSIDDTERAFVEQQWQNTLGSLQWVSIPTQGKAWALNAGIYFASGEYIANLDCDVELHPNAITSMVKAFEADPRMAAATGAIEIAPHNGVTWSPFRYLMQECEFVEYVVAFRIGRQYQTVANSLYTLAGAFSFFRREVLLRLPQYSNRTVSEDTDLTFSLREQFPKSGVGCVAEAIAYVQPATSLSKLYSQRVRWQRGELEVAACHPRLLRRNLIGLGGLSPVKTLIVDHTLAFPRVVWTFLLPMLFVVGYPLPLVVSATMAMYLCYMVIDGLTMGTCYLLAHRAARQRLAKHWWLFAVTPAYRFMLFWFRFGGFLTAMNEPAQWETRSPWEQAAQHGGRLLNHAMLLVTGLLARR